MVGWTAFGGSLGPVVLLVFGLLLAGSAPELSEAIAADPIGALTTVLPTWFLVPFALVAVLGLVGGAVLDIYSSGLALLSAGLRIPRYLAALVDGVLMVIGTTYVVFAADDFLGPFQGFLITLGVPIAAWCGVMLADIALRRRDYAERRALPADRPVRRRPAGADRAGGARHRARLGAGHQHVRGLAGLAGLPARPVRARRQGGRLGVRQPRRPGRARDRLPRHPAHRAGPGPGAGGAAPPADRWRRPAAWLVVIDMQAVFADPASGWAVPRFAAAAAGVDRLLPAFAERTVHTRFVAPAEPAGAWRAYYEQWPWALQPPDAPLYQLAGELARPDAGPADLRQVGARAGRGDRWRPGPGAGRRGDRVLRAVHRAGRGRRRVRSGSPPTPAPGPPTPTMSARWRRWRSTRPWSP